MKKIIIIALLFLSAPAFAQIKSATLTASGLTCSMCSKSIYKAISKIPYIQSVDVDVEKSSYTMQFKANEKVELDDIKKAVQDAGFSVASLEVTASFANEDIFNDAHITLGGSAFHFMNVSKQTLNGDKTFKVIDKNFVPLKEYKKNGKYTKMKCYETGVMGSCCSKNSTEAKRIYHVTI